VLTGLTLGDLNSHINIGIYNAGRDPASAVVEIHRACDGVVVDNRTVSVPVDTIQQFGGFAAIASSVDCPFNGVNGLNRLAYAVVTVNQPSLSYAAIVADGQLPISAVQVSSVRQSSGSAIRSRPVRQTQVGESEGLP
jgi:hypothetical protein